MFRTPMVRLGHFRADIRERASEKNHRAETRLAQYLRAFLRERFRLPRGVDQLPLQTFRNIRSLPRPREKSRRVGACQYGSGDNASSIPGAEAAAQCVLATLVVRSRRKPGHLWAWFVRKNRSPEKRRVQIALGARLAQLFDDDGCAPGMVIRVLASHNRRRAMIRVPSTTNPECG